jgi:hypothetical protein
MFDLQMLEAAGFEKQLTEQEWQDKQQQLAGSEMAHGGEYRLDYVLARDRVTVTVEQNTSTQEYGGMQMQVRHPPVAIIDGPNGRVSCSAENAQLILQLAEAVG